MSHNVTHEVVDNELIIRVRLDGRALANAPLTSKGKSVVIAKRDYEPLPDVNIAGMVISMTTSVYGKLA